MKEVLNNGVKQVGVNLLLVVVLWSTVWIILTTDFRKLREINDDSPRLEIYTPKNIYYVDIVNLLIQTEGSDSVFYFKDFNDLGHWLSIETEQDVVTITNEIAYEDYLKCIANNIGSEYLCYEEYLNKLTVIE